ncbi:hypothetical protein GCM10010495_51100 [Kitasatospora herbaricolor]|nr:hypothetical protein [Kitasatospora herbaricolor]GGV28739.1 hypothetical protein GCM10010495_51100 [Kitasatospora herbaricolor]
MPPPGGGEIDIMENVQGINNEWATMPCGTGPGGPCDEKCGIGGRKVCSPGTCQSGFHTQGMAWDRGTSPEQVRFYLDAAGGVSGLVEVRLDSRTNAPVGSFAVADTGGSQSRRSVPANIAAVTGTHDVHLTFTSGRPADFVNLNWFAFGH